MKKTVVLLLCAALCNAALAQLTGPLKLTTAQSNFGQFLSKSQLKQTTIMADKAAAGITFNDEESTKGTRFLFNNWEKGDSVITRYGIALNVSSYLFNYDKMTGSLLASENRKEALAVSASGIQSFKLAFANRQYNFEHVNVIDSSKFFLALVKNKEKYSLYREFVVKFIPSNYRNDGLIATGTLDNEYKDESRYYLLMPDATFRLIVFKPKAIKDILIKEKDKADQFFSRHKEDDINESFLIHLINEVNN